MFGMHFIMPTLADKYIYKGLSGETYPDRKAGAEKGIYEVTDLSLTPYLVPQECGMRMDTEWLEISRHTSLDNSRTDHSPQTLRIEKMDREFAFHAFLIQHLKLKMLCIMRNYHQQEERFYVYTEQSEESEVSTAGELMWQTNIMSAQKRISNIHSSSVSRN